MQPIEAARPDHDERHLAAKVELPQDLTLVLSHVLYHPRPLASPASRPKLVHPP